MLVERSRIEQRYDAVLALVAHGQVGSDSRSGGGGSLIGFVFELVLVVLSEDLLVRSTMIWHARMMVLAEDVRRPVEWVVANSPAAFGVAVHFADAGVDTDANGADERRFSEVGAETRPEVVVEVRATMESTGVGREPMTKGAEEGNQQSDSDDKDDQADYPGNSVSRAGWGELRRRRVGGIARRFSHVLTPVGLVHQEGTRAGYNCRLAPSGMPGTRYSSESRVTSGSWSRSPELNVAPVGGTE